MKLYNFSVIVLLFISLSLTSCSDDNQAPPLQFVQDFSVEVKEGFLVEVVSEDFLLPTSIAFPPDGSDRLFVNELQTGRVRIVENGQLLNEPFVQVQTNVSGGFPVAGENGLLGITFDPDYQSNQWVYITYAVRANGETTGVVARMKDINNKAQEFEVLLDNLPSSNGHQIESLVFGPDDKLYVFVSDAYEEEKVQDPDAFNGKILRMNRDGSIPADNPFGPDSYVYALGFRNNFDMVFRENGDLLTTENGPTSDDEFNVVQPGDNHGWPNVIGSNTDPQYVSPIHVWPQIVSPTGMLFYQGTNFPQEYVGKLFIVYFGYTFSSGPNELAKRIQVVDLSGSGSDTQASFEDFLIYEGSGQGNPLDVAVGPDGYLYYSDIFRGGVYRVRYVGN